MRVPLLLLTLVSSILAQAQAPFDWTRARELHGRAQRGETLSADDRQFLDEALRRRKAGERPASADAAPPAPAPHLTPLNELKKPYHGQDGGLYGAGQNEPPAALAARARTAMEKVQPLDAEGRAAADGKVVLLAIGMSNTTQEFSAFVPKANADARKAPHVVVVDGAQGGMDATSWSTPEANPWNVAEQRLRAAKVTPQQVQAVWIKQALKGPQAGFPAEAGQLRDRLREIVAIAKQKYPNLRVAYLSSRIYAGYARTRLNPEPYAYESAFAVRWLIQEQLKEPVAAGSGDIPVLLWGPYLWADGATPRAGDGLTYTAEEFAADGTHPGRAAREKVATLLLEFFTGNPLAKPWFTARN